RRRGDTGATAASSPARARAPSAPRGRGSCFRPTVHDAQGLTLRAFERPGRAQADLRAERERIMQVALDARRDAGIAARLRLDEDGHALGALGVENALVL